MTRKLYAAPTRTWQKPIWAQAWRAHCGHLAAFIFLSSLLALDWLLPASDWMAAPLSHAGARGAPFAPLFNLSLGLSGLLLAVFALELRRVLRTVPFGWWPAFLIGAFGMVGMLGTALLPCDAGCENGALLGQLHYLPAVLGTAALLWGLAALAGALGGLEGWARAAALTRRTAYLCLTLIILFDMGSGEPHEWLQPYVGLVQQIFFVVLMSWVFWMSGRLAEAYGQGTSTQRV